MTDSHIKYYDTGIINNTDQARPAVIDDLRSKAIIDYPDQWEMSVVRFDLTTSLVPPSTIPMVGTPVLGVLSDSELSFTMVYLGVDTQVFVQNDTAGQIFGIDRLLDQFNVCLATIHGGLAPPPASTTPPVLAFDPVDQLITMYFENAYAVAGDIELWCNFKTREKLQALPIETFAGFNQLNGKDFRLCFTCGSAKNSSVLVAGVRADHPVITNVIPDPMREIAQEALVISSWNTTRSIKLITQTLPIVSEQTPKTLLLSQQGSSTLATSNTISDFLLSNIDNPLTDRVSIEYLPTAEYRMYSLQGKSALTNVNIQAFFTNVDGKQSPVMIPPNGSFGVKLMFRRKLEWRHSLGHRPILER